MEIRARLFPGFRARSIWFDAVVALLGTSTIAIGVLSPDADLLLPDPVLIALGVLQALSLFLLRRRAPLVPFALSAVLAAASSALTAGLLLTAYAVGRYVGRWPLRIAAGVLGAVAVAQPWSIGTVDEAVSGLGGILLAIVLPGALGIWQRTRALLLAALRDRAERAEAERELLARDAVLTERTRIAREMHDAVGHRVSLMVLQAGAIEMAAADRQRVEQLAGQVQTAGRQALDELRQMVGVLRAEDLDEAAPLGPQPGLAELPTLVQHAREAGMAVALDLAANPDVDPAAGRAAYRIVQEALTNAGKHAPGATVDVRVERRPHELVVRVVNGPPHGPAGRAPGGGFGLVGLGERVRTLGGRLTAQPRMDGGFAVEAVLPA